MRVGDYWEAGSLFEIIRGEIKTSPCEFDWASASRNINFHSNTLTSAFARTLAALGVEVSVYLVEASDSTGLVVACLAH
jgi:hypothetical protein